MNFKESPMHAQAAYRPSPWKRSAPSVASNDNLRPRMHLTPHERSEVARNVLGNQYISPEQIAETFFTGLKWEEYEEELLSALPKDEDTLMGFLLSIKSSDGVLMPGPMRPKCLMDIIHEMGVSDLFYNRGVSRFIPRYLPGISKEKSYAYTEFVKPVWYVFSKVAQPRSYGSWNMQQESFKDIRLLHIPTAAEVAWFLSAYFKIHGERLYKKSYIRTSSVGKNREQPGQVFLGCFDGKGMGFGCSDKAVDPAISLALKLDGTIFVAHNNRKEVVEPSKNVLFLVRSTQQ